MNAGVLLRCCIKRYEARYGNAVSCSESQAQVAEVSSKHCNGEPVIDWVKVAREACLQLCPSAHSHLRL